MIETKSLLELAGKYEQYSQFDYGTAGFRADSDLLDHVILRVGIVACLRSLYCKEAIVGVMITASHNPPNDNGVKLIDPNGLVLDQTWESIAMELVNCALPDLETKIQDIIQRKNICSKRANVLIGMDTRTSSERLVNVLKQSIRSLKSIFIDVGLVTTPQLHYGVYKLNSCNKSLSIASAEWIERVYLDAISIINESMTRKSSNLLLVDCANGVGSVLMKKVVKIVNKIEMVLVNTDIHDSEKLNYQCGADFVKVNQTIPSTLSLQYPDRLVSIDGDADRLIYVFACENGGYKILDGDKLECLFANFLLEALSITGLQLRIGAVQTAYANGNNTKYLKETLKIQVVCVSTGVKYSHAEAQRFDIGIYFESNGHGTVLFSEKSKAAFRNYSPQSPAQAAALKSIENLSNILNQQTGDAIAVICAVEYILALKNWSLGDWNAMYTELPNRLIRIEISDRSKYVTKISEQRLVKPAHLQSKIDTLVAKYQYGRAFVRASGTENAVRIYAESNTRCEADELALKIAELII